MPLWECIALRVCMLGAFARLYRFARAHVGVFVWVGVGQWVIDILEESVDCFTSVGSLHGQGLLASNVFGAATPSV